ncbi:MAG: hypothetical protein HZA31_09105 [Opitutae bacterium]|nr:hypothetical protein [Opitutae bacterium]
MKAMTPPRPPLAVFGRLCFGFWFFGLAVLAGWAAPAPRQVGHPRLFFKRTDLAELRSHQRTPAGQAIVARLDALLADTPTPLGQGQHAAGWALRYALNEDAAAAMRALELCEATIDDRKAWTDPAGGREWKLWSEPAPVRWRASATVGVALAYDLCAETWPAERRAVVARALSEIAGQLLRGDPASPLSPASGDYALASSAAGLAALAVVGDRGAAADTVACARAARSAVGRHLAEYGERGWPRAGFEALRVSLSQGLGAFLLAWRQLQAEDLAAQSAARWFAPLYTMQLLPPAAPGAGPELVGFGATLFSPAAGRPLTAWERDDAHGGDTVALFGLTDAASRGALQWLFDRTFGLNGDRTFDVQKPGDALFALRYYPFAETALNPGVAVSRMWRDDRAGMFFFRNAWVDAGDCVAAFTANVWPSRGFDSFADAGSFRLYALGGQWAVQRQRDRADVETVSRERENVVVIPGTHGWLPGRVLEAFAHPDGSGAVALDLDAVYTVAPTDGRPARLEPTLDLGIRAQRVWAVDYSGEGGAPVVAAVVDRIAGGPARRWLLHTRERDVKLRPDGFELRAANGASLRATVLTPAKPHITVARGEWTDTVAVDGDGDFFVIMTVQRGAAPEVKRSGEGLAATARLGRRVVRYDGRLVAFD